MKKKIILILILITIFLTSCKNNNGFSQSEIDKCIPPLESFVYSASPNPMEEWMQIPPDWQIELETNRVVLMGRKIDTEIELWFADLKTNGQSQAGERHFWVYNPNSKQEKEVSGEIENSGIFVNEIFTDTNGVVWGLTNFDYFEKRENDQLIPLISKLNEDTLIFEFVNKTSSIPYTVYDVDPTYSVYWTSVVIDQKNMIWFLVPNDYAYVYNPIKDTVVRTVSLKEFVPERSVLAPNGDIYFTEVAIPMKKGIIESANDTRVFRLDMTNHQIEQIPVRLDPWPFYTRILIDHKGWLWLDALGYINEEGRLYQLEKSTIFLVPVFFSGFDYRWATPEIYLESSDGRLWFSFIYGTAWLDLDQRQWCWVSTSNLHIVEDADHNLWMSAFGKLYRKQIEPDF